MLELILIIIYVSSIFLNRFLNKKIYKKSFYKEDIIPLLWFIPFIGTLFLIIKILEDSDSNTNWFNGKNW
jgi:lipid-A-disaccharide synthase-like uncharacterized protein